MMVTRSGSVRWLGSPEAEDLREGTALLEITTDKGVVSVVWVYHAQTTRVRKLDGTVYVLDLAAETCSCPDHQRRGITCKHVKGVRAALSRIKK